MASSYVNDLRLEEIGSGEQSGTWGDTTNTNLELIAEAFSFGTEAIPTNVTNSTHTTQIADGATDPGRSMFLAYTGSQNANVTVTLAPNTVSKLWFIENATTGSSVSLIIKQGSGATITIPHGQTKAIYSDGAGTGAKIVDAFAALNVVDLTVQDDLTVTDDVAIGGLATVGETLAVTGVVTANAGVVVDTMTLDAATLTATGAFTVDAGAAINLDSASGIIDLKSAGNAFAKLDDDSGHLAIVVTQNNGDIIFKGNDDNSALTQLLKLDTSDAGSAIFGHDFYLADGQIGVFGTGNDLQIYHDGNSKIETTSGSAGDFFITAQGTGHDLYLGATDDIFIRPQGGESGIEVIGDGAVKLYHNNAKKLETSASGVTVLGNIANASGNFTISGAAAIILDAVGDISFDAAGDDFFFADAGTTMGRIGLENGDMNIAAHRNDFDVVIRGVDGGSSIAALTLDMSDAGTAIFNHDAQFPDGAQVRLGADNDLKLHLDGTTAIFGAQNGDMLLDSAADITIDCTDEINLFQGGTPRGVITMGDAFVTFGSSNNNGDVRIMGIDGGAAITALSFDMSEAGAARFIGNLVCGTTTGITNATGFSTGASGGQANTFNLTSTNEIHIYNNNNSSGATYKIQFRQNNTAVGTISASSNATAYATSSDYRLKENVDYDWDATTRLKQLKPARFNWITDDSNTLVDGFLAHEAQTVVPESVVGEKDAIRPEVLYVEDELLPDGKNVGDVKEASAPDYQQIDQAKLVPLLVKTIQELEARITTLEG